MGVTNSETRTSLGSDRGNLVRSLPEVLPGAEVSEPLLERREATIERIVSSGFSSPEGEWMKQPWDEWVAVVEGSAVLELETSGALQMERGDWVFLPAHMRHRVAATSTDPSCVWLAVHLQGRKVDK